MTIELALSPPDELLDHDRLRALDSFYDRIPAALSIELIEMFLSQCHKLVEQIAHSIRKENYIEAGRTAHRLKGSGCMFGAKQLAELSERIATSCAGNDLDQIRELVPRLQRSSEKSCASLRAHFSSRYQEDGRL